MNENGGADVDECVSLSRAAKILDVCVRTVRREIERGRLTWQMVRDAGFEPATSCV